MVPLDELKRYIKESEKNFVNDFKLDFKNNL